MQKQRYFNLQERIDALVDHIKRNGLDTPQGIQEADERADRKLTSIVITQELDEQGRPLTSKSAARYVQVSDGPFVTPRGNVPIYLNLDWLTAHGFDVKNLPVRLVLDIRAEQQAPKTKRRAAKCGGPKPTTVIPPQAPEHDAIEESCRAMGIETTEARSLLDQEAAGTPARETPGLEQNLTTRPSRPQTKRPKGTGEPAAPAPMPAWEQRVWATAGATTPTPKTPLKGKKADALVLAEMRRCATEAGIAHDTPDLRRVVIEVLRAKNMVQ